MVERRLGGGGRSSDHHEDPEEASSENGPDCSSGDESKRAAEPSPKKRRGMQKKVVSVPMGDVDGSRRSGEVYPPSDSWTWRKYGQKPIKGSPYPRGYYRCSSAKGCPARKQVERSHVDPTMIVITYASEHNHPIPKPHHRSTPPPSPPPSAATSAEPPAVELHDDSLLGNSDEFGWLRDVAATAQLFNRPMYDLDTDGDLAAIGLDLGEDEESLFADLGELPDSSFVSRRCGLNTAALACCGPAS